MLDALGSDEFIRNPADVICATLDHDDLETVVCIEVDMQGGDDLLVMGMLMLGQFVGQIPGVMIVDQGHGGNRLMPLISPLLLNQIITNQIAYGFGAITVSFAIASIS